MGDDFIINFNDNINTTKKFHIRRSRFMTFLLAFIYGGALMCAGFLPFFWITKIFLSLFCLIAFLYQYHRRVLFVGKRAIVGLTYIGNGQWNLTNKNHENFLAKLQKSSVLLPLGALLHFRIEDGERLLMDERKIRYKNNFIAVTIFYDAMPKNDFRQLRVLVLTAR